MDKNLYNSEILTNFAVDFNINFTLIILNAQNYAKPTEEQWGGNYFSVYHRQ